MAFDVSKRDPNVVRAVHPQAANTLDVEDWRRRMLASEHLPMGSQKPIVEGQQLESISKEVPPQNELQLPMRSMRNRRRPEFGPR